RRPPGGPLGRRRPQGGPPRPGRLPRLHAPRPRERQVTASMPSHSVATASDITAKPSTNGTWTPLRTDITYCPALVVDDEPAVSSVTYSFTQVTQPNGADTVTLTGSGTLLRYGQPPVPV